MAKKVFLEFEHDIEALEKKIDDLRELDESEAGHAVSVASEIASLQAKEDELVKKIYAELTPWQWLACGSPSSAPLHARLYRCDIYGLP